MKTWLVIALLGFGLYHFYPQISERFFSGNGAFDEQGNPAVVVFTFSQCGHYCDQAIEVIERAGQPYTEHVLDELPQSEADQLLDYYDISTNGLPGIVVGERKIQGFRKQALRSALIQEIGWEAASGPVRRVLKSHYGDNGEPRLVFYGTDWCPYCKKLREHLQDEGVPFTEIDVEKSARGKSYYDVLGGTGYPLTYIGAEWVGGADLERIDRAIRQWDIQ
ncbi:MAG: glutaredoxin family protein [Pseudomonadota bacterium]